MCAALSGVAAAVQAVLDAGGAELEARDDDGWTAYHWACDQGHAHAAGLIGTIFYYGRNVPPE